MDARYFNSKTLYASEQLGSGDEAAYGTTALVDNHANAFAPVKASAAIVTVLAGTIAYTLADEEILNVAEEAEGATEDHGSADAELEFVAANAGAAGNDIVVELVDPEEEDAALSYTRAGSVVTVSLATDENGDVESTAAQVAALLNDAEAGVTDLFDTTAGGDGSGVVVAEVVELSGGEDSTGGAAADVGDNILLAGYSKVKNFHFVKTSEGAATVSVQYYLG
jgi:hypothetical protein